VRVAALYDVHGMLDALDAVLRELAEVPVDAVVVGGDVVGGPQPREVLRRLRGLELEVRWLRGNGDREAAEGVGLGGGQRAVVEYTLKQLTQEELAFLGGLPETLLLDIDGLGSTLFCHATPRSDSELVTEATPDKHLERVFADVTAEAVVAGHTHMQLDRRIRETRLVNPGSVGMPFEGDVAAFWAVLGPDVEFRRTPFEIEHAAEAIAATAWPDARAFVDENLRAAVPRGAAVEHFERLAVERGERG
jgi:putative phosphoesterase